MLTYRLTGTTEASASSGPHHPVCANDNASRQNPDERRADRESSRAPARLHGVSGTLTCTNMVGDTGIEPVTSSVSGKHALRVVLACLRARGLV
jgi:hypothetical protein